jgi:hypothetical protein
MRRDEAAPHGFVSRIILPYVVHKHVVEKQLFLTATALATDNVGRGEQILDLISVLIVSRADVKEELDSGDV